MTSRDGLGLWLWHSGHWQATNFTQIGAIWTASEALGRYAFPGLGIRLVVLGCFLFALVAVWASKIVVGAHCHDMVLRILFGHYPAYGSHFLSPLPWIPWPTVFDNIDRNPTERARRAPATKKAPRHCSRHGAIRCMHSRTNFRTNGRVVAREIR